MGCRDWHETMRSRLHEGSPSLLSSLVSSLFRLLLDPQLLQLQYFFSSRSMWEDEGQKKIRGEKHTTGVRHGIFASLLLTRGEGEKESFCGWQSSSPSSSYLRYSLLSPCIALEAFQIKISPTTTQRVTGKQGQRERGQRGENGEEEWDRKVHYRCTCMYVWDVDTIEHRVIERRRETERKRNSRPKGSRVFGLHAGLSVKISSLSPLFPPPRFCLSFFVSFHKNLLN